MGLFCGDVGLCCAPRAGPRRKQRPAYRRVHDAQSPQKPLLRRAGGARRRCLKFRGSGFGVRLAGFEFRAAVFEFRVSGFRFSLQ
jgi:hypothetical protein